jgi:hypothetical protein
MTMLWLKLANLIRFWWKASWLQKREAKGVYLDRIRLCNQGNNWEQCCIAIQGSIYINLQVMFHLFDEDSARQTRYWGRHNFPPHPMGSSR